MKYLYNIFIIACILSICIVGCKSSAKDRPRISAYDLEKPEKFSMPESLLEISGITFYQGKPDTIYAIQDEDGKLFRLAWNVKKQYNSKFARSGDYEDVAIIKDRVIILKSNGTLYTFSFDDAKYEEIDEVQEWKDILPEAEYEGMHADELTGILYIICKSCGTKKSDGKVPIYAIQTGETFQLIKTYEMDANSIKSFTGSVKSGFRPSALARHPLNNDWYMVSAVNKLLVITDSNWKIKEAGYLSSNTFVQPEGIAFDKAGNMYISNEGDDLSDGNILKFTRTR
jgi:hypothetical protein